MNEVDDSNSSEDEESSQCNVSDVGESLVDTESTRVSIENQIQNSENIKPQEVKTLKVKVPRSQVINIDSEYFEKSVWIGSGDNFGRCYIIKSDRGDYPIHFSFHELVEEDYVPIPKTCKCYFETTKRLHYDFLPKEKMYLYFRYDCFCKLFE
uniref:Uncharacterized protein n=1 Tax=Agaricus bisporus virus 5 TaxID=1945749 RepID=A0A1Q1N6K2_9VIRU|nr:hypothetical protein [Agaricus bisporus virus 5]